MGMQQSRSGSEASISTDPSPANTAPEVGGTASTAGDTIPPPEFQLGASKLEEEGHAQSEGGTPDPEPGEVMEKREEPKANSQGGGKQ